jgi:ABC-type Na+ efflux pump permease subunit
MLVCAITLVFESGILSESTAMLSQNTHSYLANAVGMSAGVAPTELNQYTAQLTQKERELAAREASLEEREIAVNLSTAPNSSSNDRATYILSGILFILLVLILLNYALDYLRRKETQQPQTV